MPPQSHRDHGVTGATHWLLDEELATRSKGRASARAFVFRQEELLPVGTADELVVPPRHNFVFLPAGLVAALLVYALLASADVGSALEEVFPGDNQGTVRITTSLDEPGARELAQLHALLASTPAATVERPRAPQSPSEQKKPKGSGPQVDDSVLPPPPMAPPLIPEISLPEIPGVDVLVLPALEIPEIPAVEVSPVPDLLSPESG